MLNLIVPSPFKKEKTMKKSAILFTLLFTFIAMSPVFGQVDQQPTDTDDISHIGVWTGESFWVVQSADNTGALEAPQFFGPVPFTIQITDQQNSNFIGTFVADPIFTTPRQLIGSLLPRREVDGIPIEDIPDWEVIERRRVAMTSEGDIELSGMITPENDLLRLTILPSIPIPRNDGTSIAFSGNASLRKQPATGDTPQ